jgi:hypothetical protein
VADDRAGDTNEFDVELSDRGDVLEVSIDSSFEDHPERAVALVLDCGAHWKMKTLGAAEFSEHSTSRVLVVDGDFSSPRN